MARPRKPEHEGAPPYYYFRKGRWVYQPPGEKERPVYQNGNLVRLTELKIKSRRATKPVRKNPEDWVSKLLNQSRKRAKKHGIEFLLSKSDVEKLFYRSGGRCEITGIKFEYRNREGYSRRPWVPSIDRIESSKGYILNNCRLVCAAANIAMNEWGEDVLRLVAYGYVDKNV